MSTGTRVVVVGGGIAGLTAAFRLQQRGFDVIVLEQSGPEWIGGRMGTVLRGEFHIDVGATLLVSSYRAMLRLVVDAGAASEIRTSADVALGRAAASSTSLAEDILAQSPHFTGFRKRVLLDAFLTVCGVPLSDRHDPAAFSLAGLHCWAVVQVTATKFVLALARGQLGSFDDEDVRILLETQRGPHGWEGNILLTLWVLHALGRLPHTEAVVAAGLRKVMAHQREDGGMPFVTDTDTWCTATAGLALASAGAPRPVVRRVVAHLLEQQRPAGGWSYTDLSNQTDVDDTSVAVRLLHVLDEHEYRAPIERGTRSLYAARGLDGGFPTYLAGAPSEASMTAAALDALTPCRAQHERTIVAGLHFLADQQRDDGSFPPDWSSSRFHTVFRVLLAATRTPRPVSARVERMVDQAAALVLREQNSDGGWSGRVGEPSDPLSTAYALVALCGQRDPDPASRAAAYLIAHQRDDGSVVSAPDSIGPRPFVFTIPLLADVFVLLAFAHLDRHRAPAAPRTYFRQRDMEDV